MNKFLSGLAIALLGLSPVHVNAQVKAPIPLEQFLKRDVFGTMSISPTGEYFAATIPKDDGSSLVILRRSDMKLTGKVVLPKDTYVVGFNWVNPNRILFSIGEKAGELDFPLHHPALIERNIAADRHTDRTHFGIAWLPYLRRQVALNFPLLERGWKWLRSTLR